MCGMSRWFKNLYNQMPSPKVVVAVGICATSGCVFADAYNVLGAPTSAACRCLCTGLCCKPEAILDGILKAADILDEKYPRPSGRKPDKKEVPA